LGQSDETVPLADSASLLQPLRLRNAGEQIAAEASRAADQALHDAIARATHNPCLVGVSRQMRTRISLGFGAEPYSRAMTDRADDLRRHG
jgi:DNA-binding FadR family transcriptional regulator